MEQKYSVLMSVYINEKPDRFVQALNSMLEQTVSPDQVVIVQDGPVSDVLKVVLEQYQNEYPDLITVLVNEQNLGLGPSLNRGLLECRNELIARMDSDDVSRKDRIEKQLKMFEENESLSICGGVIREFLEDDMSDTQGYRVCPETDDELKEFMKERCPFNHMTVMYKKSEVVKAGNYQDLHFNEDYLLWIRMAEAGCTFANINEVLVDVRVGKDMYKRRGGEEYFQSEKKIQDIMLENGMITEQLYNRNMLKRKIVEKWMTPTIRSWVFKRAARRKDFDEEEAE